MKTHLAGYYVSLLLLLRVVLNFFTHGPRPTIADVAACLPLVEAVIMSAVVGFAVLVIGENCNGGPLAFVFSIRRQCSPMGKINDIQPPDGEMQWTWSCPVITR